MQFVYSAQEPEQFDDGFFDNFVSEQYERIPTEQYLSQTMGLPEELIRLMNDTKRELLAFFCGLPFRNQLQHLRELGIPTSHNGILISHREAKKLYWQHLNS